MKINAVQFIKALEVISKFIEDSGIEDISEISTVSTKKMNSQTVAVNLYTLAQLSKISKSEWIRLINEYEFDIKLNPRASSRDIIGKVLSYLESNPAVLEQFKKRYVKKKPVSGERSGLNAALDVILGDSLGNKK